MRRLSLLGLLLALLALVLGWAPPGDSGPPAVLPAEAVEERARALVDQWRERFEAEGLNRLVAGPFVIAGDGGEGRLAGYRDRTILAAQRALSASFFEKPPEEPILILLFESAEPYRRLAAEWFGHEEAPHFGFFLRGERVMLMNVGTGTGTLVHELVHALLAPDFPRAPNWFNEGLASLYEQCSIDGETIRGLPNWRLPALQKAIREDKLRPLRDLIEDRSFYAAERAGLNYAQARYLMLYLQDEGLLRDYYKRFRDGVAEDATGLKTLEAVIAPKGLEEFEREWRSWVLGLRFE